MAARRFDADVLIAGAGPAGCAAAITSASQGLRTILVDRSAEPRRRPGEALPPGVESLFSELGLAGIEAVTGARHEGVWSGWLEPPSFKPFGADASGPWLGFQVDRAALDALMLERAAEVGVEVRRPCKAIAPLISGSVVDGVETDDGEIGAAVIIDASGAARWLTRSLGLGTQLRSPRLVARYGYVGGSCPARDLAPAIIADRSGWTWTARVAPSRYQWIRLDLDKAERDPDWLPKEFLGMERVGVTHGADVSWRLSRAAAGPGWFIVGDAGSALDPASSHGVLRALMSGKLAGGLAATLWHKRVTMREAATTYQRWIEAEFERDVARLAELYARLGAQGFG